MNRTATIARHQKASVPQRGATNGSRSRPPSRPSSHCSVRSLTTEWVGASFGPRHRSHHSHRPSAAFAAWRRSYTTRVKTFQLDDAKGDYPEAQTVVDSEKARWTLRREEYTDPAVFATEKQKLFSKVWMPVGVVYELKAPGSYISNTVGGYPVFVIRGRDGGLTAFHNVCRHRAFPLVPYDQNGKCDVLRCKYHGWLYDSSGALKRAPSIEMTPALKDTMHLMPIKVDTWKDMVFVNLDEKAESLSDWLGEIKNTSSQFPVGDYVYHSVLKHEINCNWKVYVDNYQEGYHIPTAHPQLNSYIESKHYKVTDFVKNGRFSIHSVPQRDGAPTGGLWLYSFPTWAINAYSYGMDLEFIVPLAPNKTRLELYFFHLASDNPEEAETKMKQLKQTSGVVVQEDIDLCHAVQRNLEAGVYQRGVLSNEMENGVYSFQQEYRKWMSK